MEMSWNDQRRKGATQALAELVMGMDKPYELLGLFQKEALGYMLANHQVSYTSSTGDKQEAKQMRDARKVQIAKGKLPALQKELADTWPAMVRVLYLEVPHSMYSNVACNAAQRQLLRRHCRLPSV